MVPSSLLRWIKGYILGERSRSGPVVAPELGDVVFSYPKAYPKTSPWRGRGGALSLWPNKDQVKMRKLELCEELYLSIWH